MKWFQRIGIRSKLLGIVAVMLLGLGAVFLWIFNSRVKSTAHNEMLSQASRIVDTAESVRLGMEDKWKSEVFTQEILADFASKGETEKVLATVPIVTAWTAVMRRAQEGGYEFKTPKFNPRNPANEPDAVESEALKLFAAEPDRKSYSVVDKEKNAVRYFRPIRLTSECMLCHGDPKTSKELWNNDDGLDPTGYHMENLAVGDLHGAYEVTQSLDASNSAAKAAVFNGALVIAGALAVCCVILAWLLNYSLIKPLLKCTDAFARLVSGDLRTKLDVTSEDEVGRLQAGVNALTDRMRGMILKMQHTSQELNQVSGGLSETAVRVEGAASNTSLRSNTVAAAAEQMNVAMQSMGQSLRQVGTSVQSVTSATSRISANAESVAKNSSEAVTITKQASSLAADGSERIRELGIATAGVGKIVDLIEDIAGQTNLLALNATIESSRAGEAGRGFAVVATEVQQLARRTSDATTGIRDEIESIQRIAERVVASIKSIEEVSQLVTNKADEISMSAAEQEQAIQTVVGQLSEIANNTEAVSAGVEQSVSAAQEVAEKIAEVSTIATETSREVNATKQAGGEIQRVGGEFNQLLTEFSV
ncbi:Methyl-accepting chemotaxis protein CtpH [Rosistilla ulvae]|uniref:Methyl-accepting chemotaxis protein CtpH n=1 Tax=Rosistilla ulvae TaxID=1930277 RepID=A0A517LVQ8_9BACT|nr:methyl-accepting chemotaxis protein [Rosistilla ulvae]QDS86699.1 Methyl-accepting chemotaxis protein CtpH [Rosistilla ulvae]